MVRDVAVSFVHKWELLWIHTCVYVGFVDLGICGIVKMNKFWNCSYRGILHAPHHVSQIPQLHSQSSTQNTEYNSQLEKFPASMSLQLYNSRISLFFPDLMSTFNLF